MASSRFAGRVCHGVRHQIVDYDWVKRLDGQYRNNLPRACPLGWMFDDLALVDFWPLENPLVRILNQLRFVPRRWRYADLVDVPDKLFGEADGSPYQCTYLPIFNGIYAAGVSRACIRFVRQQLGMPLSWWPGGISDDLFTVVTHVTE